MNSIEWFVTGPLVYIAIAVFTVVTAYKIHGIINMPRHLRWDLYPVPHQGPEGSKYQKVDFYKAPKHFSFIDEVKEMSEEILFIKRAFKSNRKLWYGSYMLHLGFYFGTAWLVMLAAGAAFELTGTQVGAVGGFAGLIHYITLGTGAASLILGLAGTLWLFHMRVHDQEMVSVSDTVSYMNLGLMLLLFGTGLAAWLVADPSFSLLRGQIAGIITFTLRPVGDSLIAWQIFWFCMFLIYLPFSRMMHFAAKYFFYHNIMWDEEALKSGSPMEKDIMGYLSYSVEWSARHIKPQGTWLEQAASRPEREGDKK
jgi:nitrate reductase gamma subunit